MNDKPNAARLLELEGLLDKAAEHEYRELADQLDRLRVRMGRGVLTTDEWNALVGAAFHLSIDASRRATRALANQEKTNG